MFDTVLVANRGEIAVRVIRTLRRLSIRSVAVYSDADADAGHVREADLAVRLGLTDRSDSTATETYLRGDQIIAAALRTGAQAIHPGYGFLAENPGFARACAEAGLVFIGPPAEAVELMGDKINAKEAVRTVGVPVVPGSRGGATSDEDLIRAAEEIGYPVLIKPSMRRRRQGMRLVRDPAELPAELAAPVGWPAPPSVTTPCCWSAGSTAPGTSRYRSSRTPTGPPCTSVSASAACSAVIRS